MKNRSDKPKTKMPQVKPGAKVGKRGRRTAPIVAHAQTPRRDTQRGASTRLTRS